MPFSFFDTPISGLRVIQPRVFPDDRGAFFETYKLSEFAAEGIECDFVQSNHSKSGKGVVRGLHFQLSPYAQGKLVRVIHGAVWDVAVDLRNDSSTFGRWWGLELTAENRKIFYIPPGFAHGFLALEEATELVYKCSTEFHVESERGIRWDDPDLQIAWPTINVAPIVSDKDRALPLFRDLQK